MRPSLQKHYMRWENGGQTLCVNRHVNHYSPLIILIAVLTSTITVTTFHSIVLLSFLLCYHIYSHNKIRYLFFSETVKIFLIYKCFFISKKTPYDVFLYISISNNGIAILPIFYPLPAEMLLLSIHFPF